MFSVEGIWLNNDMILTTQHDVPYGYVHLFTELQDAMVKSNILPFEVKDLCPNPWYSDSKGIMV